MHAIRHRVGITPPLHETYRAVATTKGLAGWWTTDVRGDSAVGKRLEFYFGAPEPSTVMKVTDLTPDRQVSWRCAVGPDEWVGTTLDFALPYAEGETVLLFTHGGWDTAAPFLHHCSTKWAQFLLGLKQGAEGGRATPFPDDPAISSWS